jgi:peptidoglycan hydrolase-like protein with peptidoglycan-binding domain
MKIIKLTESDLEKIINKVLTEDLPSVPAASDVPGNKVRAIQNALIKLGYDIGPTGADGKYGANTMSAVKKYQRDNGIKQTGFVGNVTAGKLGVQSMASGASQTTTGGKPQTTTGGQSKITTGGQSKITSKDPSDIKSYPSCVRWSKPSRDAGLMDKLTRIFGGNFGEWFINGAKFFEGYQFFNNGTYTSIGNKKKGTYVCNENNKVILDIVSKAIDPKTKKSGNYKYSPRIDAEIQHIKNRKMDDTPFFVYDPKENLIYLFDVGAKYIASSSVVDGADVQQEVTKGYEFTSRDWCKIGGSSPDPQICTNPNVKTKEECAKLPKYMESKWIPDTNSCKVKESYTAIANISKRFLPKGIYTIRGLSYHEGYVGGSKGGKNVWSLKPIKLEGTITAAQSKGVVNAIHGIPGTNERLTASKALESTLRADINNGKVPSQYLDDIKAILAANQSYGCVGVPASFIDSPKVAPVVKNNVNSIKVFALGQDSQDFLVKNDNKQGDDQTNVA